MSVTRHVIYGLIDPETNDLRYIGRSSSRLRRARSHWENVGTLSRHDHCHCWIRSVVFRGMIPCAEILEEFEACENINSVLNDAERFWIASIRAAGAQLTNITDGGDSFPDTRGEKNWMFGRVHPSKGKKLNLTEEQRERRRAGGRRTTSDETKRKLSELNSGARHPMFGKKHSEETLMRMRRPHKTYRGKPVKK